MKKAAQARKKSVSFEGLKGRILAKRGRAALAKNRKNDPISRDFRNSWEFWLFVAS
jgi:hypothetical protein